MSASPPAKRPRPINNCAECRRLKVRCDKSIPCSACIRRGCPELCPGETLAVKDLAPTARFNKRSQLLEENNRLQDRVRELERMLNNNITGAFAQSKPELNTGTSSQHLEMLSPQSGEWKRSTSESTFVRPPASGYEETRYQLAEAGLIPGQDEQQPVTNTGTLVVVDGRSKFIGPSAIPLLLSEDAHGQSDSRGSSPQPSSSHNRYSSYGAALPNLLAPTVFETWVNACAQLPPREDAWYFAESYFRHLAWLGSALSRGMFNDCFDMIYSVKKIEPSGQSEKSLLFQKLAWLYAVLSLGTLVSQELPHHDASGRRYFELSQRCLVNGRFLTFSTVTGVHTITLLSRYCSYSDLPSGQDLAWQLRGISNRLIQSMGLHRDGQSWNLSPEDLNLRRRIFWETFSADVFLSKCWDRPTCIGKDQYDTKFPEECEEFELLRFKLTALVKEALDVSVSVKPTPYSRIQVLSQAISDAEAEIPYHLRCRATVKAMVSRYMTPEAADAASPDPSHTNAKTVYEQHLLASDYSSAIFLLLRPYFVDALHAFPTDPTRSPHASAYLAVIERSCMLVAMLRSIYSLYPLISARHWQFWTHAFSAAVCMATVCIVTPSSPLVPLAMSELQTVISLSQSISTILQRRWLSQSIRCLLWLWEKAKSRTREAQDTEEQGLSADGHTETGASPMENAEEHLNYVGWRTRLIRQGPTSNAVSDPNPSLTSAPPSIPDSFALPAQANDGIWFGPDKSSWSLGNEPEFPDSDLSLHLHNPVMNHAVVPTDEVGDSFGMDASAVEFLTHLLGAPAGQPFPPNWFDGEAGAEEAGSPGPG